MTLSLGSLVFLPLGLGFLGFLEPCAIGSHLVFLGTQQGRSRAKQLEALLVFMATRILVMGSIGALVAFVGQQLLAFQWLMELVFGLLFVLLGLVFLLGHAEKVKKPIKMAPERWKLAKNPVLLGIAFGLNVPACAAPILLALLGLAAGMGAVMAGFLMMGLFALGLSLPLLPFVAIPSLAHRLDALGSWLKQIHWALGIVFLILGGISLWGALAGEAASQVF